MDERGPTDRDHADGNGSSRPTRRRPSPTRQIVLPAAALIGILLIGFLFSMTKQHRASPAAAMVAPPAQELPGEQAPVQAWFKDREVHQIELNNALVPAMQLPRPASTARSVCVRLQRAAAAMQGLRAVPFPELEQPVRAGLDKFAQAARVCLAGDLEQAEQLIAQGLAERVEAADLVEHILEGD
jgi:hypothetical protein